LDHLLTTIEMYNTITQTYTVIDIRKTFENCEADIRTIARRTGKWTMDYVNNVFHDILMLAESKFLSSVDIALINNDTNKAVKAAKFKINSDGTANSSDRAGNNNDWSDIPNTYLIVILCYTQKWRNLSESEKNKFQKEKDFKIGWTGSDIDNSFSHLTSNNRQLYASNGYELQKTVYN